MRATVLAICACTLLACGGSTDAPDAGLDAPVDTGIRECDGGREMGCACDDEGYAMCFTAQGVQCCGGRWGEFHDGPCATPDAGPAPCTGAPAEECPCTAEGETVCRGSGAWRLVCRSGIWRDDVGRICCPP